MDPFVSLNKTDLISDLRSDLCVIINDDVSGVTSIKAPEGLNKQKIKTSHPEGVTGGEVILVASVPRPDGVPPPQTLSKKINEEEDIVLHLYPLPPELDHQSPEDVPGAAQVNH